MIVGFDTDDSSVFERQYEFAMSSGIPVHICLSLYALESTPLHSRLKADGRLKEDPEQTGPTAWSTNIVHPTLDEEELLGGLQWLVNKLYDPDAYAQRFVDMVSKFPAVSPQRDEGNRTLRPAETNLVQLVGKILEWGPREERMFHTISAVVRQNPSTRDLAWLVMSAYVQTRDMLRTSGLWNPQMARASSPSEALSGFHRGRPAPQFVSR